jgi:hypothetical protein
MDVQIMTFDGPRSDEVVAASQRAGRERILPLIEANPDLRAGLLGGLRCVGPQGVEFLVVLARDPSALELLQQVVMTSELLPGEDPALLSGPSRVDRCVTTDVFGALSQLASGVQA